MMFSTDETGFESLKPNEFSCSSNKHYCSNEETCKDDADLTCPASLSKIIIAIVTMDSMNINDKIAEGKKNISLF